jgi:hypothetical protein
LMVVQTDYLLTNKQRIWNELKPTKCICEMKNIFKILMPLLHVSAPYMRHPQGTYSSWWNIYRLRHGCRK